MNVKCDATGLRQIILSSGCGIHKFAQRLNMSPQTILNILNGEPVKFSTASKLYKKLGRPQALKICSKAQ